MTTKPFEQQFDPRQFYMSVRQLGFPKDEAKTMTKYYAKSLYEVVLQIYEFRYKLKN
jgi:hypothetical protein